MMRPQRQGIGIHYKRRRTRRNRVSLRVVEIYVHRSDADGVVYADINDEDTSRRIQDAIGHGAKINDRHVLVFGQFKGIGRFSGLSQAVYRHGTHLMGAQRQRQRADKGLVRTQECRGKRLHSPVQVIADFTNATRIREGCYVYGNALQGGFHRTGRQHQRWRVGGIRHGQCQHAFPHIAHIVVCDCLQEVGMANHQCDGVYGEDIRRLIA
ncbi:MAG: hypothetical protein BWY09_00692 [Candidatus Hydrogenedentes bacterium ADurb.Bin179]|nr:MAG: hypothetical protein BWY09_00692 [Candidatus Hydrogenedentes bacterium ADurb.Bin179]